MEATMNTRPTMRLAEAPAEKPVITKIDTNKPSALAGNTPPKTETSFLVDTIGYGRDQITGFYNNAISHLDLTGAAVAAAICMGLLVRHFFA